MMRLTAVLALSAACVAAFICGTGLAEDWPPLPQTDGEAMVPAQEWPREPGPRSVKVYIRYPGGAVKNVTPATGLMLSLHCWGHSGWTASADPVELAKRLNVVGISVDYLQSGDYSPAGKPLPYDYGYYQALDALRALWFVYDGLHQAGVAFDEGRIFTTGGSGGGNVSLMANKLAPRTFACVVDLCGMPRLINDIAFGMPGGSRADACYSADPDSPRFLAPDAQLIRFVGYPPHLAKMKELGNSARVVIIHGADDDLIDPAGSRELARNLLAAGLDVEPHFLTSADVDGTVVTSAGHILGDWTAIVFQFAGKYLAATEPDGLTRKGPPDFERRDEHVVYETPTGAYVISYAAGYPVGRFEPRYETR